MRPMMAIAIAAVMTGAIAAQDTEPDNHQIPGSSEFHFGRISEDGARIFEVVPVTELIKVAERYEVEVPFMAIVEKDGTSVTEEKLRKVSKIRFKTVPRTVLEKRNTPADASRMRTLDGKAVTRFQLKSFANRPVVMLHKPEQKLLPFYRQVFAPETLVCYPPTKSPSLTVEQRKE